MGFTNREIFLTLLELCAIGSCAWSMYCIYGYSSTPISLIYNGLWFILGIGSNLFGIISILLYNFDTDQEMEKAHTFLQYHYLIAWFCVVIGYQTLVANTWMIYTGSYYALLHSLLSVIPMIAWYTHRNQFIVIATQVTTALGFLSHFYISYLANNFYGMVGSGVMVFNVFSLSLPTRYSLLGITSREAFIIGLGAASYIFSLSVKEMAKHPVHLKRLTPKW